MHEFWTMSTVNMMYARERNYTNTIVVVVVVWCFCPHKYTSFIVFEQVVCPNILKYQLRLIDEPWPCKKVK